jgi:hypothetical protein
VARSILWLGKGRGSEREQFGGRRGGRRGTRTPDLSRVKATSWSFTVQRVGPRFILSRDFETGRDRRRPAISTATRTNRARNGPF